MIQWLFMVTLSLETLDSTMSLRATCACRPPGLTGVYVHHEPLNPVTWPSLGFHSPEMGGGDEGRLARALSLHAGLQPQPQLVPGEGGVSEQGRPVPSPEWSAGRPLSH